MDFLSQNYDIVVMLACLLAFGLIVWVAVKDDYKADDANGYNSDKPAALWEETQVVMVVDPPTATYSNTVAYIPSDEPYDKIQVVEEKKPAAKPKKARAKNKKKAKK